MYFLCDTLSTVCEDNNGTLTVHKEYLCSASMNYAATYTGLLV